MLARACNLAGLRIRAILLAIAVLIPVSLLAFVIAGPRTSNTAAASSHLASSRMPGGPAGATLTPTASPSLSPSPTSTCAPPAWVQVRSRNINSSGGSELHAISAVSPADIWAVGRYLRLSDPLAQRTLVEHWDGRNWSVVASPSVGTNHNFLSGVAAVAADDVWAVGYAGASFSERTMTLHWDGAAWSEVPSPNVGSESNYLLGVTAIASNDVWAVGYIGYSASQTLVLHWDGTQWTVVPSPNADEQSGLYAVTALASNDIWAVGTSWFQTTQRTLILHWDGSAWTIIPSPNPGPRANWLRGVGAASATDVWAVGTRDDGKAGRNTLTLHWDGAAWSVIPSPSPGTGFSTLAGVAAITLDDAWAVGYSYDTNQRIIEHWDGTTWSMATMPPFEINSQLFAVEAISAQDVWAVGVYSTGAFNTLAEHYTSLCEATPMPTPTSCPMSFTDVQPTDYFYEPVRYLYCAGVVSGYPDNTFRPWNYTTRAQLCKMVVLAEGWYLNTPSTPTFNDVPPTNVFYPYVETAALNSLVSGYPDGTFRPLVDVTRAQLCKIIVEAEAWWDYTPATPTFVDVPLSDPFYRYVETAYYHGIITGYECGPGCREFRPGNSATRGQISKMVYRAVTAPPLPQNQTERLTSP